MKSLWNPKNAAQCKDELDLLVYRSRLIGSEPKLCVWGGGNTSSKVIQKDHLGQTRRVLLVKGSGSDLKTSTRKDYPPVDLENVLHALRFQSMTDDEMVDFVSRCLLEPKAPRPSIEVLLHAFVDQKAIDHTHADAILAVTNTKNGKKIAKKIYGEELIWVPYVKPGFTLAKWVAEAYQKNPDAKGLILEKHGLITWGEDSKMSYDLTIEMVTRAEKFLAKARAKRKYWSPQVCACLGHIQKSEWLVENLPVIRKALSANQKVLLTVNDSKDAMEFVNAKDVPIVSQKGPATPDHMLRTRRIPLYLRDVIPAKAGIQKQDSRLKHAGMTKEKILSQIEAYAKEHRAYFERHKHHLPENARKMLDPYPKVILVPGLGIISSGSTLKNAQIVSEIYEHSISVMTNASCADTYDSLSEKLAFEMDYWPMELYKLSLAPPESEFSRQIGLVTGAGRGIGKAIAYKLAKNGAHVLLADIQFDKAQKAASDINEKLKAERAFAVAMDVTNEKSVKEGFDGLILKFGGIDFLVSNAGLAHVAAIDQLALQDWEKSFAVNARGHFLVAREAMRIMKRQGMGGSILFVVTKNVPAPGKDFGAYSASKAAQAQLARVLAIEGAEFGIRVNMINPDGVFEDSGLWEKIIPSRAKSYGIPADKLPDYYKNRNLMKTAVLPEDVAEAASFLISSKSAKTTGAVLPVDGGVKEAFLR